MAAVKGLRKIRVLEVRLVQVDAALRRDALQRGKQVVRDPVLHRAVRRPVGVVDRRSDGGVEDRLPQVRVGRDLVGRGDRPRGRPGRLRGPEQHGQEGRQGGGEGQRRHRGGDAGEC